MDSSQPCAVKRATGGSPLNVDDASTEVTNAALSDWFHALNSPRPAPAYDTIQHPHSITPCEHG